MLKRNFRNLVNNMTNQNWSLERDALHVHYMCVLLFESVSNIVYVLCAKTKNCKNPQTDSQLNATLKLSGAIHKERPQNFANCWRPVTIKVESERVARYYRAQDSWYNRWCWTYKERREASDYHHQYHFNRSLYLDDLTHNPGNFKCSAVIDWLFG